MTTTRRIAIALELEFPYKRHSDIFAGILRYASDVGNWQPVVDEFPQATLPKRRTRKLPYDAVIARASAELAAATKRLRLPTVNVWLSSPADKLPSVYPDFTASGRLRADHLLGRGFRNFACLTWRKDRAHERERQAFVQTVSAAGCGCVEAVMTSNAHSNQKNWQQCKALIEHWMDDWRLPIGVFVGAEQFGRQVAQMCLNRGWQVPQDVAIISGENEPTLCEAPAPGLTSIEVGFDRVGYQAARLVDRLIDGDSPPRQPILVPPIGIVARGSTDFFAVDEEAVAAALRFIAAHNHEPINVPDVARAVGMSRPTLERRFREHFGRPIAAEIRRLRLERAKRELANSDQPVFLIAKACGFSDGKVFGKTFRHEFGITPSTFRKQHQT